MGGKLKRYLLILLSGLAVFVGILVFNTVRYTPIPQPAVALPKVEVEQDKIAEHLAQAIRIQTISHQRPRPINRDAFEAFINWMAKTYPLVHQNLRLERVNEFTLLFTWKAAASVKKPILFAAHYDVVPVSPGTEGKWQHPPYAGKIVDGIIWGRGGLDNKGQLIAIIEAAENLLKTGFVPKRTIYFSFGHDEEVGGKGAAAVVALLKKRGVQLAWSLDEGGFMLDGLFPGVDIPIASINIAEKGYMTVQLIAPGGGGHSSMPPKETAVGILAEAIVKLQRAPFPGGLDSVTGQMFDAIGRELPFYKRLLFANTWAFSPLIDIILSQAKTTNALLRTTTAPTMLKAGIKSNVLAITAIGTINFRLHPRDTVDAALAYIRQTIADDRITVKTIVALAASPVSRSDGPGFQAIALVARQVYGELVIAPGLTMAATDSRHYVKIAGDSYRFNPVMINKLDIRSFHGTNERLSVENMVRATKFYVLLMRITAAN